MKCPNLGPFLKADLLAFSLQRCGGSSHILDTSPLSDKWFAGTLVCRQPVNTAFTSFVFCFSWSTVFHRLLSDILKTIVIYFVCFMLLLFLFFLVVSARGIFSPCYSILEAYGSPWLILTRQLDCRGDGSRCKQQSCLSWKLPVPPVGPAPAPSQSLPP